MDCLLVDTLRFLHHTLKHAWFEKNILEEMLQNLFTFSIHKIFSEECSTKGGTNGGSCASGFGVCCICK